MAEAVLVTRADWRNLIAADPPLVDRVLALTPNVRAAAADGPWPVIDAMSRYTDCAEARTVARVTKARRAALAAFAPPSPAAREILIDQINRVAYGAWRLWYTLGAAGPWLVPAGGEFTLEKDRMGAFQAVMRHFLEPKIAGEIEAARVAPLPLATVYRLLRRLALRHHRHSQARLLLGTAKEQFGLFQIFGDQGIAVRSLVVGLPRGGWREYAKLGREILRAAKPHGMVQVSLAGTPDAEAGARLAEKAIAAMADPVIRAPLDLYRGLLAYKFARLASLRKDAGRIVAGYEPNAFVAAEISHLQSYVLAEACGEAGARRVVMSRNALAPPEGALARDGCVGYLMARYPGGLVDEPLVFSPAGERAARAALSEPARSRIRPIVARPIAPPETRLAGERLVLLADTYAAWWFPHSYVFLTGDAFVAAARDLAQAVGQLKNASLLIRAKHKPECDLQALEKLVAPPPNCELKMRDVPFDADLARAELLVSFHSTTIEEAIFARKPVLLWGATSRYSFLPARDEPPTREARSVIYRARHAAQLPQMIQAILDAHVGRPLSDEEIAPYRWPDGTPGVEALARNLATGGARHATFNPKEKSLAPL
jgi:hypothetical protein